MILRGGGEIEDVPLGDPHVRKLAVWLPPQYDGTDRLPREPAPLPAEPDPHAEVVGDHQRRPGVEQAGQVEAGEQCGGRTQRPVEDRAGLDRARPLRKMK